MASDCAPCRAKAAANNKNRQAARQAAASSGSGQWMLVGPNAETTYYPDKLQARAANARLFKGRGMVKQVQ